MSLDHVQSPPSGAAPVPLLRRPAVVMAGMAAIIVMAVGAGVVFFGATDAPVGDTVPPSSLPPTTAPTAPTTEATPSTTEAPVTTTVAPQESSAVMDWQLVTLPGSGEVATVLSVESGLLAGGERDGEPMLWTSGDGTTWQEEPPSSSVSDVTLDGTIQDIAFSDELVVGVIGDEVWSSTDLRTWMPADTQPFAGEGHVSLASVTHGPAGFVVVGYVSQPENEAMLDHAAVWHSTDGVAWTRIEDPSFDRAMIDDVTVHDGRYVAVGLGWTPAPLHEGIWTSTDGQTWIPVEATDALGGTSMAGITSTPAGLYAIGNYSPGFAMPEQEGTGCVAIWHSPDADVWRRVGDQDDALCGDLHGTYGYAIAARGDMIVGVGESLPKSPSASQAGVWASEDRGASWDHIEQPSAVFGVDANAFVSMYDIVLFDDTYVAVGVSDSTPAVWIGSWKE